MKFSELKPRAIALGLLVDVGGSTLVGAVIGVVVIAVCKASGNASPERIAELRHGHALMLVGLVGTTCCTALGGYIAALLAKPRGLASAVSVGLLSLTLAGGLALVKPGLTPTWKLLSGLALTLPAALLGGLLAKRTARTSNASALATPPPSGHSSRG